MQDAPCKNAEKNSQKDQWSARAYVYPRSASQNETRRTSRSMQEHREKIRKRTNGSSVHPRSAHAPKSHNADRSTLYTSADQLHPAGTLRCKETSTERPTLTRIPEAGVVCHT